MQASLQGKDNVIRQLKKELSQLNNRNAHLDYLRHLKESVETIRDIVEKAKVLAHIPLIRKKQVIVAQPSNKVDSTTHPHVVTVTSQKINALVPPSTRVDCCPIAHGSQPMSHVKPNRISPAKDKMADVNAPSDQILTMDPPVCTDDQILPHISAKGTKREIFRMPIPGRLITANIRAAPYYQEYQENVAKHRGFLASETRNTQDLPAPRPAKPARKPQSTTQKAPPKPSISSPVTTTHLAPTSVTHDLPSQQKHKKTSPADQYTFKRESPNLLHPPSMMYPHMKCLVNQTARRNKKRLCLGLRRVVKMKARRDQTLAGSNPNETSEGQAGSNPDETSEGQVGPDPALEKSINCDQSEELTHDLAEARKKRKKGHESPKTPPGSPSHQPPPPPLPAALEKSINRDQSEELTHDLAEARKKRKKGHESPKTPPGSPSHQPPPPPPPAGPSGTSGAPRASGSQVTPPPPPPTSTNQDSPSTGSAAPSLAKTAATTKHQAWSTPDVTLQPLVSLTPKDLDMYEAMGPDEQAQLSDEEDIRSTHVPMVNLRQG
uniref:Histone deacetylase 14 n=1 Tax=Tanacetum cinerariifolium TaxID=118510 RepID=A0A6L2L6C4_TANCI|nr:hypothetical protein [Tanacetum cinerariifolium]